MSTCRITTSLVCVSRWKHGFVQSFGNILRPQFVTYTVEVMCVCVCAQLNFALFHRKNQCNLHLKKLKICPCIYRVIRKSLRDFRPLRYSSRDGHAEGEHVNRGKDTPNFCPTLQVLDVSTLGDATDVNLVIKFLPLTVNHVA
jgi:hypothetical protein